MSTLDLQKRIVIGLALAGLATLPLVVVVVNYPTAPISALPAAYWLLLCLEVAAWLVIVALFRRLPPAETDVLVRWRRYASHTGDVIVIALLTVLIVQSIFSARFFPPLPAILIAGLGTRALTSPEIWLKRKS